MSRLELGIAWRYLRSRRGSKLLSLISLIAIGGVTIAVSALIVIIGVMNGMQRDLRDKILDGRRKHVSRLATLHGCPRLRNDQLEARALVDGIIQLAERVCHLLSSSEQLESFRQRRITTLRFGER